MKILSWWIVDPEKQIDVRGCTEMIKLAPSSVEFFGIFFCERVSCNTALISSSKYFLNQLCVCGGGTLCKELKCQLCVLCNSSHPIYSLDPSFHKHCRVTMCLQSSFLTIWMFESLFNECYSCWIGILSVAVY